tara:strand:- start:227 stop:847 length:621 start_codon:yes stop_codon:yes gene_type:complete
MFIFIVLLLLFINYKGGKMKQYQVSEELAKKFESIEDSVFEIEGLVHAVGQKLFYTSLKSEVMEGDKDLDFFMREYSAGFIRLGEKVEDLSSKFGEIYWGLEVFDKSGVYVPHFVRDETKHKIDHWLLGDFRNIDADLDLEADKVLLSKVAPFPFRMSDLRDSYFVSEGIEIADDFLKGYLEFAKVESPKVPGIKQLLEYYQSFID